MRVLEQTVSGDVSVSATLLHFAQDALPFGGVGPSGMGRYQGQQGFDTFSNLRGVFVESELDPSPRLLTLPVAWMERSIGALIGVVAAGRGSIEGAQASQSVRASAVASAHAA